jgi:hypothetical protein
MLSTHSCASAQPTATWEHGEAYVAISKLPWLTALHAFGTCGTWSRGFHFTQNGESDASNDADLPVPFGLSSNAVEQFACERRRGWEEAPDSPPRRPTDAWDERRNARMRKAQPGGERILCVERIGSAGGEFAAGQAVDGLQVRYSLESEGEIDMLDDLQWADWDPAGRLLVATRSGKIQARRFAANAWRIEFEADLSLQEPTPVPAPTWATHW